MGSCAGIQLAERPSFYSQSASQVSIREAIDKAKAAKESNFLSCSKQCPDMSWFLKVLMRPECQLTFWPRYILQEKIGQA